MTRRVSLPMYAVNPDAVERYWWGLRRHMIAAGLDDVPETLEWPGDLHAHWLTPDLLLSQTCGYPLVTSLAGRVRYVATPRYTAAGCDGPLYSSAIVVRVDDPMTRMADAAGRRVAFNSRDSQSGYNGLRALVAPLATAGRFFNEVIETGAHRNSLDAVRTGHADIAAVDAVTYALWRRENPKALDHLRTLQFTTRVPGLPLVTGLSTSVDELDRLRKALRTSSADAALATARADLMLDGYEVLPAQAYEEILTMQADAVASRYPELA